MAADSNMSSVRATSEKVISSEKVKKTNPITGFFQKFMKSIGGIFTGCIMLFIAIGLIIAAVKAVPDNSRKVEELSMLTPEEAKDKEGLVKIQDKPVISVAATLEYKQENEYGQAVTQTFDKDALYINAEYQIYEQVKETTTDTQTVTKDGDQYEETSEKTEIREEWVTKNTAEVYASFSLGGIKIDTDGVSTRFDLETVTVTDVVLPDGDVPEVFENPSAEIGNTRMIVEYVPADQKIIAIGNIDGDEIDGGEVNMISNYSDSELISKLKGEESAMRWIIRIAAWLLLTAGFSSIVGPLLVFTDIIPGINKVVGCVTFTVFGIIAAGMILIITFAVKYWWLVIICTVLLTLILGAAGIYLLKNKKVKK